MEKWNSPRAHQGTWVQALPPAMSAGCRGSCPPRLRPRPPAAALVGNVSPCPRRMLTKASCQPSPIFPPTSTASCMLMTFFSVENTTGHQTVLIERPGMRPALSNSPPAPRRSLFPKSKRAKGGGCCVPWAGWGHTSSFFYVPFLNFTKKGVFAIPGHVVTRCIV